jgi:hypothetical protein
MDDLFLFNVSKGEYEKIFEEWLEINDKEFKSVLRYIQNIKMMVHTVLFIYMIKQNFLLIIMN